MEVTGEKAINAPRNRVYDALHDLAVLKRIMPGAQTVSDDGNGKTLLEAVGDPGHGMTQFTGQFEFYNEDPPAGYSMRARVSGGDAGSIRGNAHIALASINDHTTNLAYHMSADVTGALAELPAERKERMARSLVGAFVENLAAHAEGRLPAAQTQTPPQPMRAPSRSATPPTEAMPAATAPTAPPVESAVLHPARTIVKGGYDAEYVREIQAAPALRDRNGNQAGANAEPDTHSSKARGLGPNAAGDESFAAGEPMQTNWRPLRRDTATLRASSSQPGVGRWILTAVGVGIIIILLSDMF